MRYSDSLKKRYLWQWYHNTQTSMRRSLVIATNWIEEDLRQRLLREHLHFLYKYYKRRRRCKQVCTRHCLGNKYRKVLIKLYKLIKHQRKRERSKSFVISHRIFQSIFYYLKRWRKYLGFKYRYGIYSSQYSKLIALYRLSRGFNNLYKSIRIRSKRRGQADIVCYKTVLLKFYLKKWLLRYNYLKEVHRYTNRCINSKYFKRWMQVVSTYRSLRKSDQITYKSLYKLHLRSIKNVFVKLRQFLNYKMVGRTRLAIRFFHIRWCVLALNTLRRNIYKKKRLLKLIGIGNSAATKKASTLKRYTYYIFKRFTCESILKRLKIHQYLQQKAKHLCLVALYRLQCHRHAHCVLSSISTAKNIMHQRNAVKSIYMRMKSRKCRRNRLHLFTQKRASQQMLLAIRHLRYLARKSIRIKLLTSGYAQFKYNNNLHKINFQKVQHAKQWRRRKLLACALWKLYRSWKRAVIARHHLLYIEEHVNIFGMKNGYKKWRKYVRYTQRIRQSLQRVTEVTSRITCRCTFHAWKRLLGFQVTRRLSVALVAAVTKAYVGYNYRDAVAKWTDYTRKCRLQEQCTRLNQLLAPIWRGCYERHYHPVYSRNHCSVKLYKANYVVSINAYRKLLRRRVVRLLQAFLRDRQSKRKLCLSLYRQYIIKWQMHHNKQLLVMHHILGAYKYHRGRLLASSLWQLFQLCKQSKRRKHYLSLSNDIRQMQARRELKRSMKRLFISIFLNKRKRKHQESGIYHFNKSLVVKGFRTLFTRLEHRKQRQLLAHDVASKHHEPSLCRRYLLVWLRRVRPVPVLPVFTGSTVKANYPTLPNALVGRANTHKSQFSLSYIRDRRLMRLALYQFYQWSKDRIVRRFDVESVKVTDNRDSNDISGYTTPPRYRYSTRPTRHKKVLATVASQQFVSNQVYFTDSDDDNGREVGPIAMLGSVVLNRYMVYWKLYTYRSKCSRTVNETVDLNLQHRLKAFHFYQLLRYARKSTVQRRSDTYLIGWKSTRYRHLLEALKSKLRLKNKLALCVRRLKKRKVSHMYHQFCYITSNWLQQHNIWRRSTRFEHRNILKQAIATWCRYSSRRRLFRPLKYKRLVIAAMQNSGGFYTERAKTEHPVDVYYRNCLVLKWYAVFARVVTKRIKHRKLLGRKNLFLRNKVNFSLLGLSYGRWRYQYQLRINKYVVFKLVSSAMRCCNRLQLAFAIRKWKVVSNYKRLYTLLRPYIAGVYQRHHHRELSKVTRYLRWINLKHPLIRRVRQRHRIAMKRTIFRILIRFKHIQRISATLSIELYNQQLSVFRWKRYSLQNSKLHRLQSFAHYYRLRKSISLVWSSIIVSLKHRKKIRAILAMIKRDRLLAAFGKLRVKYKRLIAPANKVKKAVFTTKVQHGCAYYRRRCLFNALNMYKINVGYRVLQRALVTIGGNTHLLMSVPRQLQRVLFTLYIHGGNRRLSSSNWNLARHHFETKRKREAIGCMNANVNRYKVLRVAREYHLNYFMRLFAAYYTQRRIARNRHDICRLYHDNSRKSRCIRHWRDSCSGKIYTRRRVTRYYHRRVSAFYLERFRLTVRGRHFTKRSNILLYRHQCASPVLKYDPKYRAFCRWMRRCVRGKRLASNASIVSNQLLHKMVLLIRYFRHRTIARINCASDAMKASKFLRSKMLLRGWKTLFRNHFYSKQFLHHKSLHRYIRTTFLVTRLRILPHYALAKLIQLVMNRKKQVLLSRRVTNYRNNVLARAGYNCLFRYKFHRHKYLRKANISGYYYTRRLLATYYDRYHRRCLMQLRHNRKIRRYQMRKYFHWYVCGVQNIKASYLRVATIRKRAAMVVKLRVFIEWFYLYRKRNYYGYICEIIHRKRLLRRFNQWIQRYESSKLVARKSIIQRKRELRIQREYFESMKCICLYKKVVITRMRQRKLFNALRRLLVVVTARFIRQKDVRVAKKHFISYSIWKFLLLWSSKLRRKNLHCAYMQQLLRKVHMKCRNKNFYYLMSKLSRKCSLRRRSVRLLHHSSNARRLKWLKIFFSVLLQRIKHKKMMLVSHLLLEWRRYTNYNRLRRELFVLKVNKVYVCNYFMQLRNYANYQIFKKMAILYVNLSRQRSYLRLWIVAYQRTVRARVKIMDIFYSMRKYSLKYSFISWRISAKHFVRLRQLYCDRLTFLAFRQWLSLKTAHLHHKKVTLRVYFHRMKYVKVLMYQKQQHLLRKRKFYKIFSAVLHRLSSKKLVQLFQRWKKHVITGHGNDSLVSSRYSTPWK